MLGGKHLVLAAATFLAACNGSDYDPLDGRDESPAPETGVSGGSEVEPVATARILPKSGSSVSGEATLTQQDGSVAMVCARFRMRLRARTPSICTRTATAARPMPAAPARIGIPPANRTGNEIAEPFTRATSGISTSVPMGSGHSLSPSRSGRSARAPLAIPSVGRW